MTRHDPLARRQTPAFALDRDMSGQRIEQLSERITYYYEQVDRWRTRYSEMRAIVADLGKCDPVVTSNQGDPYCPLCRDGDNDGVVEHGPECPWRRAKEATK